MSLPATTLLRLFRKGAVTMCCIAAASSALAKESDVKFAGFASLAYAKTITANKEGPLNTIGNEGEYRDFNTVGFRMDADLKDNLSFAAQLVAYGQDDYNPTFDWIFANVGLTPELRLEVGKTRIPLYMYSDFIDVGYAYQWIEPPSTVYEGNFLRTLEGLKLVYSTSMGDWTSELMVFGGTDEEHFKIGADNLSLYLKDGAGLAWTVDYEWLSLRAVYMQTNLTSTGMSGIESLAQRIATLGADINTLIATNLLDQTTLTAVDTSSIEQSLLMNDDKVDYYSLGSSLDFGSTFAVLELKQSQFADNLARNDNIGGFLTFGVRLPEKVTLSLNYGQNSMTGNDDIINEYKAILGQYAGLSSSSSDVTLQTDIAKANGTLAGLEAGLKNAVEVAQHKTVDEYSLQLRWDFHTSAAFKFEYLLQDTHQISTQTFKPENVRPQAYMFGIDLVF